jgi:hypothetical protein
MTRPTFCTDEYKRSHGKEPRGCGQWAFRVDQCASYVFSPCMTYADAKRWVRAQNPNASTFSVGP